MSSNSLKKGSKMMHCQI